eukprot:723648-Ditylum_brightwellii.AAC.1
MPTIQTVKTCHDKAMTMNCSIATIKNTQQSTSSDLMKKETKCQRRFLTEMATGITATSMAVMGMVVMAHIPRLIL